MNLPPTAPKRRYGYQPTEPVHESDVLTYLEENLAEQWGPGKIVQTAITTFQVATTAGEVFTWEVEPIHLQAGDSVKVTFHF